MGWTGYSARLQCCCKCWDLGGCVEKDALTWTWTWTWWVNKSLSLSGGKLLAYIKPLISLMWRLNFPLKTISEFTLLTDGWLGNRGVSVLDWGSEWPEFKSQSRRCQVTVFTVRQTVHTNCASVHQAAKLVAALLRVAGVTAGLAESNGSLPPGLWLTSPAGWLPRTGISSRTLRSVIECRPPLLFNTVISPLSVSRKNSVLQRSRPKYWHWPRNTLDTLALVLIEAKMAVIREG